MNTSFELLSSMSPKVNKNRKPIKKAPTILALKKYFRKSILFDDAKNSAKNESIITIGTSSDSSTDSSSVANMNRTPIVISDSETSLTEYKSPKKCSNDKEYMTTPNTQQPSLSTEKYKNIQHWVDNVNSTKKDVSVFTEVSAILQDDSDCFKRPKTNVAASSTLLEPDLKRFDQFFTTRTPVLENSFSSEKSSESSSMKLRIGNDNLVIINDSLFSDDLDVDDNLKNKFLDDSDVDFYKNVNIGISNKPLNQNSKSSQSEEELIRTEDFETLLDGLYGDSWRAKKDDILPSSEPRVKATKTITKKAPNTERPIINKKNSNNHSNLLNIMQKARFQKSLQSPWTARLKTVCDSDTESEKEENDQVLSHVRLNFEDEDSDRENRHERKTQLKTKVATKKTKKAVLKTKNTKVGEDDHLRLNCEDEDEKKPVKKTQVEIKSTDKKTIGQSLENKSAKNKTYTFLESLSGNVPVEKCDLSALIFRKNFQQHKEALTARLFNFYNEKVFDSLIPKDTPIEWNDRLRGTAGTCSCKKTTRRTGAIERTVKIVLSTKVLDSPGRVRDTLIHEMCHAATWIVNQVSDGHGSFWKSWAHRAMKSLPELPPINRCHNYVINTKYTYKCSGCGYSIGRHTKSLNIDRKRCGYCYGTFEVLINKTTKKGETKSVPATPKKPTGFALFVKENYANFKTPDLKHGDVMKILGQKFSDMKINKT